MQTSLFRNPASPLHLTSGTYFEARHATTSSQRSCAPSPVTPSSFPATRQEPVHTFNTHHILGPSAFPGRSQPYALFRGEVPVRSGLWGSPEQPPPLPEQSTTHHSLVLVPRCCRAQCAHGAHRPVPGHLGCPPGLQQEPRGERAAPGLRTPTWFFAPPQHSCLIRQIILTTKLCLLSCHTSIIFFCCLVWGFFCCGFFCCCCLVGVSPLYPPPAY